MVRLHETNSRAAVHPAHDRCVAARWKVCDNRRFPSVSRSVTAVLNFLGLVVADDAADSRNLPIVIRGNLTSTSIVQFQCRIRQWIGNTVLTELGTDGTYDHSLCSRALDDEPANHHVV